MTNSKQIELCDPNGGTFLIDEGMAEIVTLLWSLGFTPLEAFKDRTPGLRTIELPSGEADRFLTMITPSFSSMPISDILFFVSMASWICSSVA